jgi:glycosyltransferase involved in cell wall biosynthesis
LNHPSSPRAEEPLVSIITPAYNAAKYLPCLFDSVRGQTWKAIEHIVIDDGSKDEGATLDLLSSTPGIQWHTQSNRGQYATINRALDMVRGDIVTIISADDYYAQPNAIESAVRALEAGGPSLGGVFGRTVHVDSAGVPLAYQPPHRWPRFLLPYLFTIAHCSLFLRTSQVRKSGIRWNEGLRYVGDAEWILNLMAAGVELQRIPDVISRYRIHDGQMSTASSNPVRLGEHRDFDRRHGVVPAVDWIVRRALGLRRHLVRVQPPSAC